MLLGLARVTRHLVASSECCVSVGLCDAYVPLFLYSSFPAHWTVLYTFVGQRGSAHWLNSTDDIRSALLSQVIGSILDRCSTLAYECHYQYQSRHRRGQARPRRLWREAGGRRCCRTGGRSCHGLCHYIITQWVDRPGACPMSYMAPGSGLRRSFSRLVVGPAQFKITATW